jgi:hypothetical protein
MIENILDFEEKKLRKKFIGHLSAFTAKSVHD